jgi:archaeosine synthase alpha-subunit
LSSVEVKRRDGLARTGTYTIEGANIAFPAVLDTNALFPGLKEAAFSNIPLSAEPEFVLKNWPEGPASPVMIHPHHLSGAGSGDCVMVPGWHTTLNNPRNYVAWLSKMKVALPPDTVWYAPAAAIPSNIHILCYSGFDMFDFIACDLAATQGVFLLPEGEFDRKWMGEGVCNCEGCQSGNLKLHNRIALTKEVALVSRFIIASRLREFVESRCRMHSTHVAIMRLFDSMYDLMEQALPVAREVPFGATSGETLNRIEIHRFAQRVVDRYQPPQAETAVLLPCSARKPYSFSRSHNKFSSAIQGRAHELIVTSPVGLVPRELELVYPAAHYDVPVTGYWDREEKAFISGVIAAYLQKNRYRRVIAHLEGGALEVAKTGADIAGIDLEYTCSGRRPTDGASLAALDAALTGCRRVKQDLLRGICSWQFGTVPDTSGLMSRGRYPAVQYSRNRVQMFSVDTGTGLIRPTFEGWKLLGERYRVHISDFIPQGDILAPGVEGADPGIREGDEVLVVGPRVLGTGRAAMGASEMTRSKRGVAVRVRKIKMRDGQ